MCYVEDASCAPAPTALHRSSLGPLFSGGGSGRFYLGGSAAGTQRFLFVCGGRSPRAGDVDPPARASEIPEGDVATSSSFYELARGRNNAPAASPAARAATESVASGRAAEVIAECVALFAWHDGSPRAAPSVGSPSGRGRGPPRTARIPNSTRSSFRPRVQLLLTLKDTGKALALGDGLRYFVLVFSGSRRLRKIGRDMNATWTSRRPVNST